ncbi:MAG: hypothetical protein LUH05_08615 [Candidatus Gastranaerophilales bacterium]|nr:hypothetical protein [Candidatus Gastranaerophilales bacterium]
MTKRNKLQFVCFTPNPDGGQRFRYEKDKNILLDTKTGYTLYEDKLKYPSIFNNKFTANVYTQKFNFEFEVYGHQTINNDSRYRWNNADIKGILQAFCSADDRRIILPSGIHDYMLEFKREIYELIKDRCSIDEYRHLTSEIFIYLCIQQGFSSLKAKIMGNAVDLYQKKCCKKSWEACK